MPAIFRSISKVGGYRFTTTVTRSTIARSASALMDGAGRLTLEIALVQIP
jgi:hypothetical protein